MVSLHTGYKELLSISTSKVSVIIKGKSFHPCLYKISESEKKCSSVCIYTKDTFELNICNSNQESQNISEIEPLFFEQQNYELIIEGKEDTDYSFWHENKNIRESVSFIGHHKNILSGILNFGNDIGYSDLVICKNNQEILRIRIEVFPSKISYKEDYKALIQDIISEVYNIIFDFLKRTYNNLDINSNTKASPIEFFSIINQIFNNFEKALNLIIRNPHHTLQTIREILPPHKVKRIDNQSLKWIKNHPESILKNESGYNVDKILSSKKQITYDTKENQLLKFIIISVQKKLKNFENNYKLLGPNVQIEIINKIQRMVKIIDNKLTNTFFEDVSNLNNTTLMSLVFTMAPGYRDIYKYYLMLQHGLAITSNVFNLSLKDVALLYEYWCFLKLNRIIKDKYELNSPDIVKVERNGLSVNLKKGNASKIKYLNPKNNEIIELTYNPSKRESPTGPQKPDNVLYIQKNGSSNYEYIFDAKYRIDSGTDSNDPDRQTPGPKEDTINTMHRYRDAIVYNKDKENPNYKHTTFGAYVLFPYLDEEEYKKHKFYKSINEVNIGGLPFLPSATKLVSNFIEELIEDSPDTAFDRTVLPLGIEEKLKTVDWNKKDVLIGMLRKGQLEKNIEHKFYHIPAEQIKNENLPIHWIALYQSENIYKDYSGIVYYGEVIKSYRTKRKNIKEIPARSGTEEKLYYRFDVKSWEKLDTPIGVKEFGPPDHRFTNFFLLQNSTVFPELFLKDEEEYRLYCEIKYRINKPQYIDNPFGFKLNDYSLFFSDNEITISNDKSIVKRISFNEFFRKPHETFKKIQNLCI